MPEKTAAEPNNIIAESESPKLKTLVGAVLRMDDIFNKMNENNNSLQSRIINQGLLKRLAHGIHEDPDDFEIRFYQQQCCIQNGRHRLNYDFSGEIILDGKHVCERSGIEWHKPPNMDDEKPATDKESEEALSICASLLARAALTLESYIAGKKEIVGDPTRNQVVKSLLEINNLKGEIADISFNLLYSHGFSDSNRKFENALWYYRNHLLVLKKANVKLGGAFYRSLKAPLAKLEEKMEEQKHPNRNQSRIRRMIAEAMEVYNDGISATYYEFTKNKKQIDGLIADIKSLLESLKDENLGTSVSDPYLNEVLGIADPDYEVKKAKRPYR